MIRSRATPPSPSGLYSAGEMRHEMKSHRPSPRLKSNCLAVALERGLDQSKVLEHLLGLADRLTLALPVLRTCPGDTSDEARKLALDAGPSKDLLDDVLAVLEDAELDLAAVMGAQGQVALFAPAFEDVTERLAGRGRPALAEGADDARSELKRRDERVNRREIREDERRPGDDGSDRRRQDLAKRCRGVDTCGGRSLDQGVRTRFGSCTSCLTDLHPARSRPGSQGPEKQENVRDPAVNDQGIQNTPCAKRSRATGCPPSRPD
jgi:hypothetical protein